MVIELFEIYDDSSIILDEYIASNLIYQLIETNPNCDYFSYLDANSESLKLIYDYFVKLRINDVKIEDFHYSKEKEKSLKKLFTSYKKYIKENKLADSADIYKVAIKHIDKYLKQFESVFVDSFKIENINLVSSKHEEELLQKIKKNKLSKNIGRPRKRYENTLYRNDAFNSYDEVRIAIKIAKKLIPNGANENDIIIVTSDSREYLPYYYNLLEEYGMQGYDTTGVPLNVFAKNLKDLEHHKNIKVQKAYWKFQEQYNKIISLSNHFNIAINRENLQATLMKNSMVRSSKRGVLFTDLNKFISLQDRYKHIIFIGTDITHFPPKSKDNFLFSQTQTQNMFYGNNIFDSSKTLYNELKRLSDNLYIVTSTYKGKRKLSPSLIIDKNIDNPFNVDTINSRNDLLKNSKRIDEKELEQYQQSVSSKEFTSFDGLDLGKFSQGDKLSASALNTYQKCPMQYYFNSVLKLNAPKDEQDGFDAQQRGSLMHLCFELFVNEIKSLNINEQNMNTNYLYKIMLDISNIAFNHKETLDNIGGKDKININHHIDLTVLQNGLDDINENKGELAKFVDYFIANKFEYFKNSNCEELFMLDSDFKVIDLQGLEPKDEKDKKELKEIDDEHRFIKGFVDRLDNLKEEVNIIDYKSSVKSYSQNDFIFKDNKLKNYQLGIYMLYAMQKYPNKSYKAHLLSFKDQNYNDNISIDNKIFDNDYSTKMKELIKDIQQKINSGNFSFDNSDEKVCEHCNYKHICHQAVLNKEIADAK